MRTFVRAALIVALLALPSTALAKEHKGHDAPSKPAPTKPQKHEPAKKPTPVARPTVRPAPTRAPAPARTPIAKHGRPKHAAEVDAAPEAAPDAGRAPGAVSRRPIPPPSDEPSAPAAPSVPPPADPAALAPVDAQPVDPRQFGYGASVADLGRNAGLVRSMGFNYLKSQIQWHGAEPAKGQYNWRDADNVARATEAAGLKLVLRVDTPPDWAAPGEGNRAPNNPQDFADFMRALATHLRGHVAAYEIWNEPNLAGEWGGAPDPERYAELLRAAYPAIKAADPGAVVVSAGLATTAGDGGKTAVDDLEFIQRMYDAGVRGSFDALGSHPYGFATAPDQRAPDGVSDFQRAADQYQLMVDNGDADKAIWATEVGWLVDPGAYGKPGYLGDPSWAGREWQKVDPQNQANYLVQAYQYAYQNWPWMGVMLVFNLDFSTVTYYSPAEQMRWYGLINPDGSSRPAFDALRGMVKPLR